jgi:hypothetical protein
MWLDARMELIDYIAQGERRKALAEATGSSPDYLWQIATKWVRPTTGKEVRASTDLALAIERETTRLGPETVPKESLRPDVWPANPAESSEEAA